MVTIGLGLAILVPLLVLFLHPSDKFNLEKEADFYVIKAKGVTAYQLSGGQLSELSSTFSPIVDDTVNHMVQRVDLGNRYLMFSDEDLPASINSKLVSIDFETGLIKREKSSKTAFTSSGKSDRYYYTSEATTEGMRLTAFDADLNEKFSYSFGESVMASDFWVSGDLLYLTGAKAYEGDYEDFLFVFREFDDHIELVEEELLHYDNEKRYMFGDSYILNGKLFIPVAMYRNRETKEKWGAQEILEIDLESREKTFYPITYSAPYQSFLVGERYIAFSHEYGVSGKLLISLFDTQIKESIPIDLEEQGLAFDDTFVRDIKQYDDSTILILLADHLLVYNIAEQRVVLSEQIGNETQYTVALWVNR